MQILKKDDIGRTLAGLVYVTDLEDTEGDVVRSIEVLKSAAREFEERYDRGEACFNVDHGDDVEGVEILENTVLDKDEVRDGYFCKSGSWYLKLRIPEELWPRLKDANGFSMQGEGDGRMEYENN